MGANRGSVRFARRAERAIILIKEDSQVIKTIRCSDKRRNVTQTSAGEIRNHHMAHCITLKTFKKVLCMCAALSPTKMNVIYMCGDSQHLIVSNVSLREMSLC